MLATAAPKNVAIRLPQPAKKESAPSPNKAQSIPKPFTLKCAEEKKAEAIVSNIATEKQTESLIAVSNSTGVKDKLFTKTDKAIVTPDPPAAIQSTQKNAEKVRFQSNFQMTFLKLTEYISIIHSGAQPL